MITKRKFDLRECLEELVNRVQQYEKDGEIGEAENLDDIINKTISSISKYCNRCLKDNSRRIV